MLQRFNSPNLQFLVGVGLPALSQTPMLCTQQDTPIIQYVHKSIMNSWVCLAEYAATFHQKTILFPLTDEAMMQTLAA